MRFIFTCLSFLVLLSAGAQPSFKSILHVGDDDEFSQVIVADDGSYIAVGDSYNSRLNATMMLIARYSPNGTILLSKMIGVANESSRAGSIIKTRDGGYAIGGNIAGQFAIVKLDKALNITWKKKYTNGEYGSGVNSLVQTGNGDYIAVGAIIDADYFIHCYFLRTDSTGNALASKQYFRSDDEDDAHNEFLSVVPAGDGNYALLSIITSHEYLINYQTSVMKVTPYGDVIWTKILSDTGRVTYPSSMIAGSDGGLVITGSLTRFHPDSGDGNNYEQTMIAKLDADGRLLWSHYLAATELNENFADDITEDKNGNYLLSGGFAYGDFELENYTNYSMLATINPAGSLLSTKLIYESDSTGVELGSVKPAGNGYIAGGAFFGSYFPTDGDETMHNILMHFDDTLGICESVTSDGRLLPFGSVTDTTVTVDSITFVQLSPVLDTVIGGNSVYLCQSALPLQLLSFAASLQNRQVNVSWTTANEVNTSYFVAEKGAGPGSFSELQTVAAKGINGSTQKYTLTDLQPLPGTSYYRLKQVDRDGKTAYSDIASVTMSADGALAITPNPVQNQLRILLQSEKASTANFEVLDMKGKRMMTQTKGINEGANTIIIPAASLAKGVYILRVIQNSSVQSIRFLKE